MEKFFYFRSESILWKICSFNFRNYNFLFFELPLHVAGEKKLKSETRLLYGERKMRGVLVYFLRLIACILCDAGKSSLFCVPTLYRSVKLFGIWSQCSSFVLRARTSYIIVCFGSVCALHKFEISFAACLIDVIK